MILFFNAHSPRLGATLSHDEKVPARLRYSLGYELAPVGLLDRLQFTTGEVFSGASESTISGTISFSETDEPINKYPPTIVYVPTFESKSDTARPASFGISYYVSREIMQELVANLRAGLQLAKITAHFPFTLSGENEPFSYRGFGDTVIWNTAVKEHHRVKLEQIDIRYLNSILEVDNSDDL